MELPELTVLSRQMSREIVGKRFSDAEVARTKCLKMPLNRFQKSVIDKTIKSVESRG